MMVSVCVCVKDLVYSLSRSHYGSELSYPHLHVLINFTCESIPLTVFYMYVNALVEARVEIKHIPLLLSTLVFEA